MANAASDFSFDWTGARKLVMEFVEQLFDEGLAIEEVWGLNDDGFAPFGDDDDQPTFQLTLREIDACRARAHARRAG